MQMVSTIACSNVRMFLEEGPEWARHFKNVHMHWIPSHTGHFLANTKVDKSAQTAANVGYSDEDRRTLNDEDRAAKIRRHHPNVTSVSFAKSRITEDVTEKWKKMCTSSTYVGRQFAFSPKWRQRRHKTGSQHWKDLGPYLATHEKEFSRFSRMVTGHAPIGAFRERFNLEGMKVCACGVKPMTRDHVLYGCHLWTPIPKQWYPKDASGNPKRPSWLDELDPFSKPGEGMWVATDWLQLNPLAFTFEFADMHAAAAEEEYASDMEDDPMMEDPSSHNERLFEATIGRRLVVTRKISTAQRMPHMKRPNLKEFLEDVVQNLSKRADHRRSKGKGLIQMSRQWTPYYEWLNTHWAELDIAGPTPDGLPWETPWFWRSCSEDGGDRASISAAE